MCYSSIWATAETGQEQEALLGTAGATFSCFFPIFSFYWGQIFTIVFHFSPRNEYFCSLEFMGNAVNHLEVCACGTKANGHRQTVNLKKKEWGKSTRGITRRMYEDGSVFTERQDWEAWTRFRNATFVADSRGSTTSM